MVDIFSRRVLANNASKTLSSQVNYEGLDIQTFRVEKSARLVFYLTIDSVSTSLLFEVNNSAQPTQDFKEIHSQVFTAPGQYLIPLTDIQRYFSVSLLTSGGPATYTLSCILAENSSSGIVEDAIISIEEILQSLAGDNPCSNFYNEIASVPIGASSDIVSYTVPLGKEFKLFLIEYTGSNIATYNVKLNSSNIAKQRTWFNGDMSGTFRFPQGGLLLAPGDVLTLSVDNTRPYLGDFEGRIYGIEQDG